MTSCWLMKSEPDVYSIDDLQRDKTDGWEGVRNYQARNFMRAMRVDDLALFYHSNATPSGIVGLMRIVEEAHPDPTQFETSSKYYDPTSTPEAPRWSQVRVAFVEKFAVLPLAALKADPALDGMELIKKGSRLSVMPVSAAHFAHLLGRLRQP